MIKTVISIGIAGMLLLICLTVLGMGSQRDELLPAAKGLLSETKADRLATAKAILDERRRLVEALLSIASKEEPKAELHSPKAVAIELLGQMRAEEAVDFLLLNITYQAPYINWELQLAAGYPCVNALENIGLPSVKGVLARLEQPATEKELDLFAKVIKLVDGDDIAAMRVEMAAKTATGKKKENLRELLKILKMRP